MNFEVLPDTKKIALVGESKVDYLNKPVVELYEP
jgi:hypothetical protein